MRNHQKDVDDIVETPVRDVEIGKMRAAGMPYQAIGDAVGLGKSRVAVICERDDVKAIIENEQKRLVSLVPSAVDNYKTWIMRGSTTNNKDEREVAYKASTKVLESTGILNGAPSTLVQILYNDNKTIISPVIMGLLKDFTSKIAEIPDIPEIPETNDSEIIEAEFAES